MANRSGSSSGRNRETRNGVMKTAVALHLILALGCTSVGTDAPDPPSIEVSGRAEISASPDVARFRVVISSEDKDPRAAAQENAQRSERVTSALTKALGNVGSVATESYAVTPRYRWNEGKQILLGHQARNTLQVEVSDLERVGALADVALDAGADSIEGMVFTLKDPTPLSAIAVALAAGRAKQKADAMADALQLDVVRILHVQEQSSTPRPRVAAHGAFLSSQIDASPTPIHPGPIEVTGAVLMRVEVSARKK